MKKIMLYYILSVVSAMFLGTSSYAASYPVAYCPAGATLTQHATGIVTAPNGWTSQTLIASTKIKNSDATFGFLGAIIGEGPSPLTGSTQAASCSYIENGTHNQVELYNNQYNFAGIEGDNWLQGNGGYDCSGAAAGTVHCPFTYFQS